VYCSKIICGLIARLDLVLFARTGTTSLSFILLSKRTTFFLFSNTFVVCVRVFGLIGTIFVVFFWTNFFFFYIYCLVFFLALILFLFDSLVLVYKSFSAFLAVSACFLRAIAVLFPSILALSAFLYTFFSTIITWA
jgi:hypothetical protein